MIESNIFDPQFSDNTNVESCRFREHPVNSLGSFQQAVILVSVADQLNADPQTGRSGKHRQRDAYESVVNVSLGNG